MKKGLILTSILILTFGLAGCNLPIGQNNDDSTMQTAVALNVALTQLAATQTALAMGPANTNTPSPEPPTATLEFTATITNTLEPSITPTPEGVWLSVLENTNCRSGPGTYFDRVVTFNVGTKVEAVGKSTLAEYYYVKVPNVTNSYCWLWSKYSTVTGNVALLPVFTPQPTPTVATPTPSADFIVSYNGLESCGGSFAIQVYIKNTGSVTWESVEMTVKDNTTSDVFVHEKNEFKGANGCAIGSSQDDLTAGEDAFVANINPGQFPYDPSGHDIRIIVTLYSKNGQAGTSITKKISVTP